MMTSFGASARRRPVRWTHLGAVLAACALLLGTAIPAAAAELMRITLVRHGQSAGNASGLMDSSTPGPVLTPQGHEQAAGVPGRIGDRNFDGVYASTMVRTQLTAAPLSQYLGLGVRVLPGLREIEAGDYEGTPESEASSGYMLAPLAWTFQGNLDARIPGSLNGHEFNGRMNEALQAIYDNGDRNAAAFTHGAAMMFWTLMNAQNLTPAQKMALLSGSMPNTGYVVLEGNPTDGWKLINWNGEQIGGRHSLVHEVALQIRTLNRQLAATAKTVFASFATRDLATIATAINRGISEAAFSVSKFNRAIGAEVIGRLDRAFSRPATVSPASTTLAAGARSVAEIDDSATASDADLAATPAAVEVENTARTPADPVPSESPREESEQSGTETEVAETEELTAQPEELTAEPVQESVKQRPSMKPRTAKKAMSAARSAGIS